MLTSPIHRILLGTLLIATLAVPSRAAAEAPSPGLRADPDLAPRRLLAFGRAVPLAPSLVLDPDREGPEAGTNNAELSAWTAKQHKLKIQTGVSGGLSAGFLLTSVLLFTLPIGCNSHGECDDSFGHLIVALALVPASAAALISSIVYGVRLTRHNRARPANAQVGVGSGGLMVRF